MAHRKTSTTSWRVLLTVFLFISSSLAFAGSDDVMITRDGTFIPVKVLRIDRSDIRFINLNKKRQGEMKAPTDFVYMIMKEKGSNIFFDEDGNQMTSPQVKLDKKDNVLFLNDGKYFPVFDVSIGKENISYKLKSSKKAPVYQKKKDEVFLIKNGDGTTTLFNNKYVEKLNKAKREAQERANAAPVPPTSTASSLKSGQSSSSQSPSTPTPQSTNSVPASVQATEGQGLKLSPAPSLDANAIVQSVYRQKPYTLYGKGTVAEYVFLKGNEQVKFMGGPTYIQQIVADEKVNNGLLTIYVRQAFLNKKHEPSKGISATFKSYYFPTDIDSAVTFHLTHDISRDIYMLNSRKGYALLIPSTLGIGEKIRCGAIVDEGKNIFGGKVALKATYSDFQVDGLETVNTPAGTFDCIRIKGKASEDNSGSVNKYQYTWWLARGVGFVKYEIKTENAKAGEQPLTITLNKIERP